MKHYFQKDDSAPMAMAGLDWKVIQASIDKMPDGAAGMLEIKRKSVPKSQEALGYYYAVILPMGHKAIRDKQLLAEEGSGNPFSHKITINGQELELPIDSDTTDILLKWRYSKFIGEFKDKADMDNLECAQFMDWCIKWLWQHYQVAIPPSDKDWNAGGCELPAADDIE